MCTNVFRSIAVENQLEKSFEERIKLLENGYQPIPLNGKRPGVDKWPDGRITSKRIRQETYYDHPHHGYLTNTGCRTGEFCALDIDLRDDNHSYAVFELTEEILGSTSLRRHGSKGVALGYYNPDSTLGKLAHVHGDTNKTLVEILGRGNQLACFGVHPDVNRPYIWCVDGYSPLTVPLWELPRVTDEQVLALHRLIGIKLTGWGYPIRTVRKDRSTTPRAAAGKPENVPTDTVTDMFLRLFPSGSRSSQGFVNFICPACRCSDGRSGYIIRPDGGFRFQCFHTGCDYFGPTGWSPGGGLGERTIALYRLLGGDPDDLPHRYRNPQGNIKEILRQLYDKTIAEAGPLI